MPNTKFTNDFTHKTITIEAAFDASLNDVWQAWTTQEILDQWFGPAPYKAETKSFDFRPDGSWLFAMVGPEGDKAWGLQTYLEIVPQKYYTLKDQFSDENGNVDMKLPHSGVWRVEFKEDYELTNIIITITYYTEEEMRQVLEMKFEEGMRSILDNLEELLSQN